MTPQVVEPMAATSGAATAGGDGSCASARDAKVELKEQ